MLHFDLDPWLLKTQTIWRRKDINAAIGAFRRYLRAITHGTKKRGDKLLHLRVVQFGELIFDQL